MNHFRQRIPAFIDTQGIIPIEFDFETIEELQSHPYVKSWIDRGFSDICKSGKFLMAMKFDRSAAYAIGWIKYPDLLNIHVFNRNTDINTTKPI